MPISVCVEVPSSLKRSMMSPYLQSASPAIKKRFIGMSLLLMLLLVIFIDTYLCSLNALKKLAVHQKRHYLASTKTTRRRRGYAFAQ